MPLTSPTFRGIGTLMLLNGRLEPKNWLPRRQYDRGLTNYWGFSSVASTAFRGCDGPAWKLQ
jgi:hypothetical protein